MLQPELQLAALDPTMDALVRRYRGFPRAPQGLYPALVRAIISQQISNKAASTIRAGLRQRIGLEPLQLIAASTDDLRSCGLPQRKLAALQQVARLEIAGELKALDEGSDASLVRELTALPGIGAWTAEMVLIFGLHRPDVWPTSDHGLRTAVHKLYHVSSLTEVTNLGERFRPWRSYAAWYFWRSLEND